MTTRREGLSRLATLLAAPLALCPPAASRADEVLRQAIIVVGSPAGGATDKLARFFAQALSPDYARSAIVENRPGATGVIAYQYVKNSRKDGSITFLAPSYALVMSPHIIDNLPYDSLKDFAPVAITGRSGMTFVVGPATPASVKTFDQYLQWCRAEPRRAFYAAQTGSVQHLAGAVLARITKVPFENVSYKGDSPGMQDLLGGYVPAMISPIASVLPFVRTGQVRSLATTRGTTVALLPEVPSFHELGYDLLFQDWLGVFAPAGTPAATVDRMNEIINRVLRSAQGVAALDNLGFEIETVTPQVFAQVMKSDYVRYGALVEETGFKQIYEKAAGR